MHLGVRLVRNPLLADDPEAPIYNFTRRRVGFRMPEGEVQGKGSRAAP